MSMSTLLNDVNALLESAFEPESVKVAAEEAPKEETSSGSGMRKLAFYLRGLSDTPSYEDMRSLMESVDAK